MKEEPKKVKEVIEEKITMKEDTLYNVMSQLESTQSRYIIVGILISFVVSFMMWQVYNSIFGKKQIAKMNLNKNKIK
jgi:hypothetical protein